MVILNENVENFPVTAKGLPKNYNFEIPKTLRVIKKLKAKNINLQFPDGLLCYAPVIIEIIKEYTSARCTILNDVVYGACCVDDSISTDLLIHYGHSCLIPISDTSVRVLYIFVDIRIDIEHLYKLILQNFNEKIAIIGTIQFNSSVNILTRKINSENKNFNENYNSLSAVCPQAKPLSPGEVLGCTSPIINDSNIVIYIGDGRFHLESAMIRNPSKEFYKYCPFTRKLSKEFYDFEKMKKIRENEIKKAFLGKSFGIILGTLGRQGNLQIFKNIEKKLGKNYKIYKILAEEINEKMLDSYSFVDSFVQVSCPRLSIDWGHNYKKPLLSPFEVFYKFEEEYKMDYYSKEGFGEWKNYNNTN